jgi:hypothetical protein
VTLWLPRCDFMVIVMQLFLDSYAQPIKRQTPVALPTVSLGQFSKP